jgi:hypothetical protein
VVPFLFAGIDETNINKYENKLMDCGKLADICDIL